MPKKEKKTIDWGLIKNNKTITDNNLNYFKKGVAE